MTATSTATTFTPRFKIGDAVYRRSFIDCFGEHIEAIHGLAVSRVEIVEDEWPLAPEYRLPTYARVTGANGEGHTIAEGAERFFESEAK